VRTSLLGGGLGLLGIFLHGVFLGRLGLDDLVQVHLGRFDVDNGLAEQPIRLAHVRRRDLAFSSSACTLR